MPIVKVTITPNGFTVDGPGFVGCDKHLNKFMKLGKVKKVISKKIEHTHIARKINENKTVEN